VEWKESDNTVLLTHLYTYIHTHTHIHTHTQALQTHRVAHWLWKTGRDTLAFFLQSQVGGC